MAQLNFDPETGSIAVDTHLKGKFTYHARLVLDTGSTLVMIPWRIATALKLEIDPENLFKITTASTVESSPLTSIPEIGVLGKTIKNVPCIIRDLPKEAGVDGLLGLSFLRHFSLAINFKRGVLEIK
jgi:predicted aspartyl protease